MQTRASKLFKTRLRELRAARGWTQEQAAEVCGISYKLYQLYELGIKTNPGLLTLEKIACGYGIKIHELLSPDTIPFARSRTAKRKKAAL